MDGEGVSGEIVVSGSSTVEPITSIALEDFTAANPDVTYSVDGPGTGDGFALFCAGETDISDASRAITEEEVAACEENGIGYVELQIAIDGLSVITSPDNADVTCLSFGDLYALLGPESQGFDNWSDADGLAGELGADFGEIHAPYPDADLVITAPGEESGTFDSFVELVVADVAEAREQDETTRPDYQTSGDDNVIIENIAGSPSSLGWVGFAFADENADAVKLLEVDGGDGLRRADARDDRQRRVPDLAPAVHLRERGRGRGTARAGRVRRLLPLRRGHRLGHRGRLRRARHGCPGRHACGLG